MLDFCCYDLGHEEKRCFSLFQRPLSIMSGRRRDRANHLSVAGMKKEKACDGGPLSPLAIQGFM